MVGPLVAVFLVAVLGGLVIYEGLRQGMRDRVTEEAAAVLTRGEVAVETWLERYRALPALYARHPDVRSAALSGGAEEFDTLNAELAAWNGLAGTSDTYLMTPEGTTRAASNWRSVTSFVGQNFSYRPYFTEAIAGRTGQFFGLGTTSGLRGYYFSAPIEAEGGIVGIMVVKILATDLEAALADTAHPLFVTDDANVVALSGLSELILTSLDPVSEEERALFDRTRRYDSADIAPAPIERTGDWDTGLPVVAGPVPGEAVAGERHSFLHLERPLTGDGWTLHLLYDLAASRAQLRTAGAAILAGAVALAALAMLALQRRQQLIRRLADRERDRTVLERKVTDRTAALTETNARLQEEVAERRAAELSLRRTQGELVQAGKLAALGQMSAALSHEFNQPLGAIRAYTENAQAFYERGRSNRAKENLDRVLRLTERMAQLSKHLTRFARRSGDDVAPVSLDAAVAEALELLAGRIQRSGAEVRVTGETDLAVAGGAVRLQHVIMNLVGNAIEAVPEGRIPEIWIALSREGAEVTLAVSDNGTGIPEDVLPRVFDPFFTTKGVGQGLGLGLSISYNIVKDFGGTMRAETQPRGGARFVVTLRAADIARQEAAE